MTIKLILSTVMLMVSLAATANSGEDIVFRCNLEQKNDVWSYTMIRQTDGLYKIEKSVKIARYHDDEGINEQTLLAKDLKCLFSGDKRIFYCRDQGSLTATSHKLTDTAIEPDVIAEFEGLSNGEKVGVHEDGKLEFNVFQQDNFLKAATDSWHAEECKVTSAKDK